ncbi:hypothetical protein KAFR_0C03430 [Kazachstania africana CBS 2517]|uniref:Enhancer of polycomb-like protein n=1 Tax=Kazachstania africana (strain ATCC 22294 / BCRC 22015 / CBS 2517 / CECT 1963 / NBRC 1671 / NRRL Y-8276) TaxID=1071382 RepID=H2ASI5_KAZAF|nr:hypothetical protein KAFR_0C03430 [Kazachstania africana CBS 2517]CCF57335.1 hypothetical protein KAFR_0C03430 [Kazachstania africana CBS 2517]
MPNPTVRNDKDLNTRFRHRKISVKQRLRIYQPNDLKNLDKDELQQREVVDIETGVEKNEEKEVHLLKILQKGSNQQINDKKKEYIPTPSASTTWNEYDDFYYGKFQSPVGYIKFSATVEDCCGAAYNMDETDEIFLKDEINDREEFKDNQLSEDEFEILCTTFENAIRERQPFLGMDPETILSFEEIKPTLLKVDYDDNGIRSALTSELNFNNEKRFLTKFDSPSQAYLRALPILIESYGSKVYDHWKLRKIESNGTEIFPQLKFERPGEKEEVDPYVCFRRREVRHPRKTRRIDIINSQKLRLLRKELEHAKELAFLVAKREQASLKLLEAESDVFSDRCQIKSLKRNLNLSAEEDDLINHKRKRTNLITLEKKKQLEEEALAAKLAKERAEAAAAITSDSSMRKANKGKLSKRQLEQMVKSGAKLTKQQLQQLKQYQKNDNSKLDNSLKQLQQEKNKLALQSQQQAPSVASHVYVKLPSSKVPDIVLDDVDNLLSSKERNARNYVQERMEKRRIEDANMFFNLTDDPFNPIFDITLPNSVAPSDAPFSSIASSKFEIDKSYYVPDLRDYLNGTTDNIIVFNKDGEKITTNTEQYKKLEIYDPFQQRKEIHSREYPVKFRRRIGRCNIQYFDRKPNGSFPEKYSSLNEFIDFDAIEKEEYGDAQKAINVYDSKADELVRLYDKWKYDSPQNDYGLPFSVEPSKLNKISNETQVIRFGTMLGSKSYEQLRKSTIKYRREYIARIKQQKIDAQQSLQQDQQSQRESPAPGTQINKSNSNSTSSIALSPKMQSTVPLTSPSDNPVIKNETKFGSTPSPMSQAVPVTQKKTS